MNVNAAPFWYRIITQHISDGPYQYGLTIPYIIGARNLVDNSYTLNDESVRILMEEIVNSVTEKVAVLRNCPDINQYVLELKNRDSVETEIYFETSFNNFIGDKTLYITGDASKLGGSFEEISIRLSDLYSLALKEKRFSWKGFKRGWDYFSDYEENLIKSL